MYVSEIVIYEHMEQSQTARRAFLESPYYVRKQNIQTIQLSNGVAYHVYKICISHQNTPLQLMTHYT